MELIERQNLISALKTLPEQERLEIMGVYDLIKSMPTIEAEPVVHGYWKNRKYRGIASSEWFNEWNCSKCGGSGSIRYKYCTHCGAKMDEKKCET